MRIDITNPGSEKRVARDEMQYFLLGSVSALRQVLQGIQDDIAILQTTQREFANYEPVSQHPTHASSPRNKLIAQVFFDMGLIERYGSGIQRILDDCRDAGLPAPLFENFSGGFRILFRVVDGDKSRGVTEGVIEGVTEGVTGLLNLIAQQPGLRTPALAEKMGTSPKNVERWLKQLKAEGHIEFRGASKTGGYWSCAV